MFLFSPCTETYCYLSISIGANRITASESPVNLLASVPAGPDARRFTASESPVNLLASVPAGRIIRHPREICLMIKSHVIIVITSQLNHAPQYQLP